MGTGVSKRKHADRNTYSKTDKSVYQSITIEELANLMMNVENIVIVPGNGMANAKAQFAVGELTTLLKNRGKKVRFALHPVAGRLPGHMNVLLAEANVPYELIYEMDDINEYFKSTELSLLVGANDIVNPAAISDSKSPIYGMPVLRPWESKHVVIINTSLENGYSDTFNPLFYLKNAMMLLGDAKETIIALNDCLNEEMGPFASSGGEI